MSANFRKDEMKRLTLALIGLLLVLLLASPADCGATRLRILYVNDFHGFAMPYQPLGGSAPLGGVAYLAGAVDRLRTGRPTLLLAAGDMIQGNIWANLFQGRSAIALMNAMKFDAMVVGNHEFDFGQRLLQKRIAEAHFPVLGANVGGLPQLKPYVIKNLAGLRVGIIGVVTQDTPISTHPRNVQGLTFSSPEAAVRKHLPEVRSKADLVIVLSHIGYAADRTLAEKVPGIPVIVGGHSHTKLLQPVVVGHTIIVQAWEHAKALGVLDLDLEDGKIIKCHGYLQEIKPEPGTADPQIQALVNTYNRKVEAVLDKTVGSTLVDLDGDQVRTRETNLGDLVADIMRETAGADAAIINGGGIRTSIPRGKIKLKNVYSILPFNNYLVAVRLTGKQVKEALEHGVSDLSEHAGRFPQVSGLAFTYNPGAPAGSRIQEITLGGRPLDPQKTYVVATNDFLAAGGDGYKVFREALKDKADAGFQEALTTGDNLVYCDQSRWLRDLVIDYLKAHKKIAPRTQDRIKEIH